MINLRRTKMLKRIIYFLEDLIFFPLLLLFLKRHTEDIKNALWYIECFYLGKRDYKVSEDPYLKDIK